MDWFIVGVTIIVVVTFFLLAAAIRRVVIAIELMAESTRQLARAHQDLARAGDLAIGYVRDYFERILFGVK